MIKSILETVRLSLLLSNVALVVSETSSDTKLDNDLSQYLILTEYDKLVDKCTIVVN